MSSDGFQPLPILDVTSLSYCAQCLCVNASSDPQWSSHLQSCKAKIAREIVPEYPVPVLTEVPKMLYFDFTKCLMEGCTFGTFDRNFFEHIRNKHSTQLLNQTDDDQQNLQVQSFKCDQCSFIGASNGGLLRHKSRIHKFGFQYDCKDCDYIATNLVNLKRHQIADHNPNSVKCDKCDFAAANETGFRHHMAKIHGIKRPVNTITCKHCNKRFKYPCFLEMHYLAVHILKSKGGKYFCNKCEFTGALHKVKTHLKSVHGGMDITEMSTQKRKIDSSESMDAKRIKIEPAVAIKTEVDCSCEEVNPVQVSKVTTPYPSKMVLQIKKQTVKDLKVSQIEISVDETIIHSEKENRKYILKKQTVKNLKMSQLETSIDETIIHSEKENRKYILAKSKEGDDLNMGYEYDCSLCNESFPTYVKLSSHCYRPAHQDAYSRALFCKHCQFACMTRKDLHLHEQCEHPNRGRFGCKLCNMLFRSPHQLRLHKLQQHRKTKLLKNKGIVRKTKEQSSTSTKVSATKQHLKQRIVSSNLKRRVASKRSSHYECKKCDFVCTTPVVLFKHHKSVHGYRQHKLYECSHCAYAGLTSHRIRHHELTHYHPKGNYRCKDCDFTTGNAGIFLKHKDTVHGSGLRCQHCDFVAVTRKGLSLHVFHRHKNDVKLKYKCDSCEFVCMSQMTLNRHLNTACQQTAHSSESLRCQHCDYVSGTKQGLSMHVFHRHKNDVKLKYKYYKCDHCDFASMSQAILNRHLKYKCEDL